MIPMHINRQCAMNNELYRQCNLMACQMLCNITVFSIFYVQQKRHFFKKFYSNVKRRTQGYHNNEIKKINTTRE